MPALRAFVAGEGALATPLLSPASRRRKLHIPHFRLGGRKLAHSAAPPFPNETALLGFVGGPIDRLSMVVEDRRNWAGIPWVGEWAALIPRRAHRGLQGQQLGRWPVLRACWAKKRKTIPSVQTGGGMVGYKGTGRLVCMSFIQWIPPKFSR